LARGALAGVRFAAGQINGGMDGGAGDDACAAVERWPRIKRCWAPPIAHIDVCSSSASTQALLKRS